MAVVDAPRAQTLVSKGKLAVGLGLGAVLLAVLFVAPLEVQVCIFLLVGCMALVEMTDLLPPGPMSGRLRGLTLALVLVIMTGVLGAKLLLEQPLGTWRLFVLAVVVVATDVGAQLIGRRFGTPGTFFPRLSPGKSLAGALGGLVVALVLAAIGSYLVPFEWPVLLLVPPLAVAGDLLASAFKRELGVKDFANYIPGTGGLLDRIDSWLPALALVGLVGAF